MVAALSGLQPQTAWMGTGPSGSSPFGLDAFLDPDAEILRRDELQQLSGAINQSGLRTQQLEQLGLLLKTLRSMPPEDLLALLALLSPEVRQRLAEAFSQSGIGSGGQPTGGAAGRSTGGSGGGAAPARSSGGGTAAPRSAPPGRSTGTTGTVPAGPAPGGTAAGQKLAQSAAQIAGSRNTTGWCYRGVADAVRQSMGVSLTGGSAYMAADQLANSSRFKEVKVGPGELKKLPPGAIVVWGQTGASPHGHISVALGDGREASDHIQQQMTSLRGSQNYRVFIPQS